MSADVTKVFIEGMEACTDEQRAEIEASLREHNAQDEYIKSLRAKIDLLKAEYKAATGTDFDEYLNDAL
ncbi:MAG: hypothetical protein KBT34_10230 [Prevotella sp.]|nr:hypothetical protein [Candidatus Prevotella equi]